MRALPTRAIATAYISREQRIRISTATGHGSPAQAFPFALPPPIFCSLASCRVTALLLLAREQLRTKQKADTTAKVEAHARLCSLINGSAHVLSSSWFFLLSREASTPTTSSRGGAGGSGGGVAGDALHPRGVSRDGTATVPIVVVRRLAQTCGIVRSSEGGPTPAHADAQLRRNAVGKGRLGYREV